ncbi:MAG: Fmu (Sun) domain-containing protein, partial [Bacteroidota bacterium]|nr:Fmu (Sun) domain-containing protein [Bacteroidota bacterium]
VPCTGSGTWARTPEQLSFFHKKEIDKYVLLQRNIIKNAVPQLKKNAHLLYITCSVFKKENEENVSFIEKNLRLKLVKMNYLKGYKMQADTLFAALFEYS